MLINNMADRVNKTMASNEGENESITGSSAKRALDGDEDNAKRLKGTSGFKATLKPVSFSKGTGIKLKINSSKPAPIKPLLQKTAVFNDDSEEEEEIPKEARARMRNIGRNTPTSSGPNSFGKTKQGFCNVKKVFENNLKTEAELAGGESSSGK